MDLNTFTGTQTLAIWGAITGTIGTITGIFSLWLRFSHQKRDQARLKCEAVFDYEVSDGTPKPRYKIIIRNIGRRPVTLESVEYFLNPTSWKDRLFRRRLWAKGQWRMKNTIDSHRPISLSEGQKTDYYIVDRAVSFLDKSLRVKVIDQTGHSWNVPWPTPKELTILMSHGVLDRTFKENARRSCKVNGYYIKDKFYILAQWNAEPPKKNQLKSRGFRFENKNEYENKLSEIMTIQIPKILEEKILEIS